MELTPDESYSDRREAEPEAQFEGESVKGVISSSARGFAEAKRCCRASSLNTCRGTIEVTESCSDIAELRSELLKLETAMADGAKLTKGGNT